ncbi:hypothetical protein C8Q77DRAFT_1067663 [Trametes polyzona]|nr:hypothetical protein C8Q77DRAFT_1067663 [Trametes polyzona]
MSQADPLAHLWPVLRNADKSFFISIAATTLAIYEHLITLRLEVHQIWRRSPPMATVLFVMTRYFMLLNRLFVLIGFYPVQDLAVSIVHPFSEASVSASVLIVVLSAVGAIRIYALWNRDYRLFAVVMLTGMFPAFANLFFRSASSVYIIPTRFYSCQSAPTAMTAETYRTLAIVTRVVSIVSDGLVVVLTWIKTFRVYTLTRRVRLRADYSALILRDGEYRAICALNLVAILYICTTGTNLLNDLIVTLSAILMARFLLNLRDQRAHFEDKLWPAESASKASAMALYADTSSSVDAGMLSTMGGEISMGSTEEDEMNVEGGEEGGEEVVTTAKGDGDVESRYSAREKKPPDDMGAWA